MNDGIISYAQNFEDVMLWRALAHVGKGNYIDVGAQSAYEDSVSRAFHEHGWNGVHVEPMPFYAEQLRKERTGDVIVQAMVGAQEGMGALFAMSGTGLSTSREDLAEGYERDGREVVREVVPVVTLDQVLDIVDGEVHWLKIDVEGAEHQVLQGWHGDRRPWVLVIESTRPMSQEQNYEEWEPLVIGKGYRFVYFDGLNRFYVSEAHHALADAFQVGPNVFDRFRLAGTATSTFTAKLNHDAAVIEGERARIASEHAQIGRAHSELERQLLQQRLDASERENTLRGDQAAAMTRANQLQEQLSETRRQMVEAVAAAVVHVGQERDLALTQVAKLHSDLMIIHSSTSWVVTAPLRVLSRALRALLRAPVGLARSAMRAVKPAARRVVFGVLRRGSRSALLRRSAGRILASMPALDTRIRAWHGAAIGRPMVDIGRPAVTAVDSSALLQMLAEPLPEDVSAQARQTLLRLRYAIAGAKS